MMFHPFLKRSYENDFDLIKNDQDKAAFFEWSQSLRDVEDGNEFRTTDAIVAECAAWSLHRCLSRAIPPDWTWIYRGDYKGQRIVVEVTSPAGHVTLFGDSSLGILVYTLEHTNWATLMHPPPPVLASQPLQFAAVDMEDPFERARAEVLLKRHAASAP